ncbi:MAG: hypothetical protein WD733_21415 [Bryobacterales bacterium]
MPNLAKSCQTTPLEDSQSEPGAIDSKAGGPKPGDRNPGELKPNQQRALFARLEAPSVTATGRESGIGDRTIHRWLQ